MRHTAFEPNAILADDCWFRLRFLYFFAVLARAILFAFGVWFLCVVFFYVCEYFFLD